MAKKRKSNPVINITLPPNASTESTLGDIALALTTGININKWGGTAVTAAYNFTNRYQTGSQDMLGGFVGANMLSFYQGSIGGWENGPMSAISWTGQDTYDSSYPELAIGNNQRAWGGTAVKAADVSGRPEVAVFAASLPLPAGAATSALQTSGNASLTTIAGKDFATQTTLATIPIAQTTALGSNKGVMMMGSVGSAPTYVSGNIEPLSVTTAGALRTTLVQSGLGIFGRAADGGTISNAQNATLTFATNYGWDIANNARSMAVYAAAQSRAFTAADQALEVRANLVGSAGVAVTALIATSNTSGTGYLPSSLAAVFDDTSPTAITENNFGSVRMSANRNLYGTIRDAAGNERGVNVSAGNALLVDGSATTQPVSAVSLPLPSGATTESTLSGLSAKFGTLGQKASSGSAPVVMASDGPGMTIASPLYIAFSTGLVSSFGLTVDGGGSPPTTGSKGYATVPYAGTIIKWWITSDVAGSCVVDLKRSSVSIVGGGGNKPTLTAASSNNAVVSGWTSIAVALGDTIEFNLDSVATLTRFNLFVAIVRS